MKDFDFRKAAKRFQIGEAFIKEPSMRSYIQNLEETLNSLDLKSQTDRRRIEVALEAARGIKRHVRRLEEDNKRLEEQLTVLLEEDNNKEG